MTMILDPSVSSLPEYVRLKSEQQAAGREEAGRTNEHKYLVPERPDTCPECLTQASFWVKAYFFRWAIEGDLEEAVPVPRYICNHCGTVVSVLFAFLVPYRQFTANIVGTAIQTYLLDSTTYRGVAADIGGTEKDAQRPNHSQVWHWVNLLAGRAVKDLNVVLQRACITANKEDCLSGIHECICPNVLNAGSLEKVRRLNGGTRFLLLAALLLKCQASLVEKLQTYFTKFVQPAFSILTGRGVKLWTPQSLQHVIW